MLSGHVGINIEKRSAAEINRVTPKLNDLIQNYNLLAQNELVCRVKSEFHMKHDELVVGYHRAGQCWFDLTAGL